jgi:HAD superfamily hydrolase (TIGR01509 family)
MVDSGDSVVSAAAGSAEAPGEPVVIFDCNGVLVDSEPIASAVLADALRRVGLPWSADVVSRAFHGRRPADIIRSIEQLTKKTLPADFSGKLAADTLKRLSEELRAVPHAAHALTWIRGPKAVASSSPLDRIRTSLEVTGLLRFFEPRLFTASNVVNGKPAPDLFLLAAKTLRLDPADCIVVEDSVAGITAASAAGMRPIGFIGRSQVTGSLAHDLRAAGACAVIADMRALKGTIIDLRGW